MDDDVVVVGGGLAGCLAALAAAQTSSDRSVGLVSKDDTTLRHASGLVDILGYMPGEDEPLAEPYEAIPDLPPSHPYSTVGVDSVREGMALFDDVVGGTYAGDDTETNALVPTYGGHVKPTARYPKSMERGLANQRRETTIVGFEQLTAFDAALTADRLGYRLPYRVTGMGIQLPIDASGDADSIDPTPLAFAKALDRNEETDEDVTAREGIVNALEHFLDLKERIGFPAVLGLEKTEAIREMLADELDRYVFELPMGPPSVPGVRLQSMLAEALADADVRVHTGTTVIDVAEDDGYVEELVLEGGTSGTYEGSQFVLATGGVAGGGVSSDRDDVHEPVFDCHVEAPSDRSEWVDAEALGNHPFASFGVSIDEEMRPRTESGTPEYENLRAAGGVIGGYNFAAEKSGSGVSIATGYAAGIRAGEDV